MTEKKSETPKEDVISLRQFKEIEKINDLIYNGFKAEKNLTDDSEATRAEFKKQITAYAKKPAFKKIKK